MPRQAPLWPVRLPPVEAFESRIAVAPEAEDFVVSGGVKFRAKLPTDKAAYAEEQNHGY
jgi:hypothetical protein